MNGKILKGALLMVAALALTGAKPLPAMRLDVTGAPAGAKVFVDGEEIGVLKDATACSATQLKPGLHLLHVEAQYHWPLDTYVRLDESESFVTKDVNLKPTYGLVLLKTQPAGATVTYHGRELEGRTPLLIGKHLQCGPKPHKIELSLNGYKKTTVDIPVPDRKPIVRDVPLVLDSGTLLCSSEPAGATVFVDGIERGTTPVKVHVPSSRGVALKFSLTGYEDMTLPDIRMSAGEQQERHVKMQGLPARLTVVTEPENAKVYLDGNDYLGKSPVQSRSVKSGTHEIRAELSGYAPITRTVELPNGGELTEKLVLESILGRIEVSTDPVGAKVSLDGRSKGETGAGESRILMIPNVEAGEHTVQVYLSGYLPQSKTVTVTAKETKQLPFTLRRDNTPNTDVEKKDGTHVKGLFKRQTADLVVLEVNGTERLIPRDAIRRVTDIKTGMEISVSGASVPSAADPEKR